jgi:hypothetical protein
MKYFRLYTDRNGESHFEAATTTYAPIEYAPPAPALEVSEPVEATRYVMVRFPAGWDSGLHPAPRRQLKAGDVLLMEDTEGKGHAATVKSRTDVLGLMVHLE